MNTPQQPQQTVEHSIINQLAMKVAQLEIDVASARAERDQLAAMLAEAESDIEKTTEAEQPGPGPEAEQPKLRRIKDAPQA